MQTHVHSAERPIPLSELAQTFGLTTGTARYHLTALEACGLVTLDGDRAVPA